MDMTSNPQGTEQKAVELEACPFHHEQSELDIETKTDHRGEPFHFVDCSYCGCKGPAFYDRNEALTAWNTRAARPLDTRVSALERVAAETGPPPFSNSLIESIAKRVRPTLFSGLHDDMVGPATLRARDETREMVRSVIRAALASFNEGGTVG